MLTPKTEESYRLYLKVKVLYLFSKLQQNLMGYLLPLAKSHHSVNVVDNGNTWTAIWTILGMSSIHLGADCALVSNPFWGGVEPTLSFPNGSLFVYLEHNDSK